MRFLRWLNPQPLLADLRMFFSEYMLTRSGAAFLRGIPFLIAMGVLLGLVVVSRFELHDATAAMEQRLDAALAANDYEEANLLVRQLLRDRPNDEYLQFQAGRLNWGGEEHARAFQQLLQLAVRREYGPAAVFLIDKDEEAREQEIAWLDSLPLRLDVVDVAVKRNPKTLRYQAMQANLLLAANRVDEAVTTLRGLAEVDPSRAFQLALILKQQGKLSDANQQARAGIALLTKQGVDQQAPVPQRMLLAALNQFLENWDEALEVLQRQGSESDEESQQLGSATARVLLAYSQHQQESMETLDATREGFVRLSQAVRLAPNDPQVINAVSNWLAQNLDADAEQMKLLQEAVVQGMSPGFSHFILGTTLMLQGEGDKAAIHLEMAEKELPNSPAILNNLAFTLASQEKPDLERALRVVQAALEQRPDHPYIRDTRGQVLLKMGRYQEAIVDLEFVLREPRLKPAAHRALATAYTELGQPEIAARHQQLVSTAESSAEESPSPEQSPSSDGGQGTDDSDSK